MGSLQNNGLEQTVGMLCERTESLLARQSLHPEQRLLVALAGVPGSGKSTISAALIAALSQRGIADVVVVPMVLGLPTISFITFQANIFPGWFPLHEGYLVIL
jgi:pantothenate kinase